MAKPPRSLDDIDFDNLSEEDIAWCNEQLRNPSAPLDEHAHKPTPARWRELSREVLIAWGRRQGDPDSPYKKIGRFDAEGMLGVGSYGCVFKVRDTELDRPAALKLCIAPREDAEACLMNEAKILAKLDHPNILTVYEVGRHEGDLFMVTQLVKGPSIYRHVTRSEQPPSWVELVELFCTVGLALAAAHDLGVIHRDIKPSNILVDLETNTPYIADFGLARARSNEADESGGGGTLAYRSAELLRGGESDERSDQYAFCFSLWECIDDGIPPYGGRDAQDYLFEIEGAMPTIVNKDVPQRIRDVLRRGLSEDPGERYASMRELVHELRLALGPRLVTEGEDEESSKPRSRRRNDLIFTMVVLLTAGLLLHGLRPQDPAPTPTMPTQLKGCAASGWTPGSAAQGVCTSIRLHNFAGANQLWIATHGKINPKTADGWVMLAHDSLSVAQTFAAEGRTSYAKQWCAVARDDYEKARDLGLDEEAEEERSSAIISAGCE